MCRSMVLINTQPLMPRPKIFQNLTWGILDDSFPELLKFLLVQVIYQIRETVFHRDIHTPR